jgi:RND family efflux transporter MFP subunit
VLLGLVVVAAGVGIFAWLRQPVTKPGQESAEPALQVRLFQPQRGGLNRLCVQPATVEAWESVDLYAEVTGILRQQTVDIYSRVQKGQVLARIDAADQVEEWQLAKALVRRAQDAVAVATARLKTAMAMKRAADKIVIQREAEKKAADAYVDFRKKLMQRYMSLASTDSVIKDVADEEHDRYTAAYYRATGSVLAIEQAKKDVEAREAEIEEARAALEVAHADVTVAEKAGEKAKVFVDFMEVKAPFTGVITFRSLTDGAFIRAKEQGSRVPLLTIKRTDKFRIVTYVPDMDVPYIQIGDPVKLKIASLGMVFKGKVARRALSQQEGNRLMRTEIDMDNKKGLLRDGMYGEVTIQVGNVASVNPDVVNLPAQCLQDEGQARERIVYVVRRDADGKHRIHRRTVLIGYNQDKGHLNPPGTKKANLRIEVLHGLSPQDLVVNGRLASATEGTIVEVRNEGP